MITTAQAPNQNPEFRLALPKKGRLKEAFDQVLQTLNIGIEKAGGRLMYGRTGCLNNGVLSYFGNNEVVFERDSDALQDIELGGLNLAIMGRDKFVETVLKRQQAKLPSAFKLVGAFKKCAPCRLVIAGKDTVKNPSDLEGATFATSYPATLRNWLDEKNIRRTKILERDGGIEDYTRRGIVDFVCDVVETGGTLKAYGLTPIFKIMQSYAVAVEPAGEISSDALNELKQALFPDKKFTM